MNTRKKMLTSVLAASLVLTCITGVVVSDTSDDVETLDNGVKIRILKEKVTSTITDELVNSIWGSIDEFNKDGGYYFEGDISYIGAKSDDKVEELKKLNKEKGMPSNIRPYKVKYSWDELNQVKADIEQVFRDNGIEAYSIDPYMKRQSVVVEIPIISDENRKMLEDTFGEKVKIVTNYEFKDFEEKEFEDVSPNDWYHEAVLFLRKKGVVSGNRNNEFEPDIITTRQDSMAMTYRAIGAVSIYRRTPEITKVFTDQGEISPYADKAIKYFESTGSISGYPDGSIHPRDNITRSEAAVFLSRVFSYKIDMFGSVGTMVYSDINPEAYYAGAIQKLINAGILGQEGGNEFRPDDDITRAEFGSMLYKICK